MNMISDNFFMNIFSFRYNFRFHLGFLVVFIIATSQVDGFCGVQFNRQPFVYNIEWVYQGSGFNLSSTVVYEYHNHFNYKFKDTSLFFISSNTIRIAQYNNFCELKIKSQNLIQTDITVYTRKQNWIFTVQSDNIPDDFLS